MFSGRSTDLASKRNGDVEWFLKVFGLNIFLDGKLIPKNEENWELDL